MHLPSVPASVSVFPCHQQKTVCTIAAHEGTLAAIAFNALGSKLASASEKVSALAASPLALLSRLHRAAPWGQRSNEMGLGTRTDWSLGLPGIHFRGEPLTHACCVCGYIIQQSKGLCYARCKLLDTKACGLSETHACTSSLETDRGCIS